MKKILFTLLFLMVCVPCFADHWVYVRTYDRTEVELLGCGRSKSGDVVDIREVKPGNEPSETAKSEWAIFQVSGLTEEDISELKEGWEGNAYRKKKLNIQGLKKGLNGNKSRKEIKDNLRDKTNLDLISYAVESVKYASVVRPIKGIDNYLVPFAFAETVSTVNKVGEDYDTLTLWEDAKDGALTTETRQEQSHLYNDQGDLTDSVLVDGSTTNATYYMKITVPAGERHNGTDNGGATITSQLSSANGSILRLSDLFSVAEWLIVILTTNSGSASDDCNGIQIRSDDCIARHNIVYTTGSHNAGTNELRGIYFYNDVGTWNGDIYRNIVYGFNHSTNDFLGIECQTAAFRTSTFNVHNNTIYNCDLGFVFTDGNTTTINCRNNVSIACDTDYTVAGDTITFTYNCSDDATAPANETGGGSTCISTGTVNDFVSTTDMHLVSAAVQINVGATIGTSPSGVDYDIDNVQVSGTWDMGADEYVATSTALSQVIMVVTE